MIALVITAFVILLTAWYFYYYKYEKYLKNFKGPRPWPLIGNALEFGSTIDQLPNLMKLRKKYGSVIKLHIAFQAPYLFISDSKFLEFLLSSTKLIEKSNTYRFASKWLGTGLLTSGGVKWKKQRKILTPAFHFQILEQFVEVFNHYSDILIKKLEKEIGKNSTNIYPYITLNSLDIICATSMGTKVNAQDDSNSKYVYSVKEMSRILLERTFSVLKAHDFFYYFSKDYQKEREALRILHGYTNAVIASRKQEVIKDKDNQDASLDDVDDIGRKKKKTFLDLLLQYRKDGQTMSDKDIREEVDTFMFEGHDTTASAISFALYCLAKHSDVQNKVVQELKTIFDGEKERPATYRDLQEMKYLEAVVKETLRLYPSVPIYARNVYEDVEYDGGILPKGTTLVIFAYGIHRDPEAFPDPERFDPERFVQEKQIERSPYAYVPFSAGPRNCIGQRFAMLEMKLVLSKILRNYELLEDPNHQLELALEGVLKSANGIRIQLKKRHNF